MKTIILKAFNSMLASVLFLLGFCQVCIAQYGIPQALFKFKGIVKSENDIKEIKGIQVVVNKYDTSYTNEKGEFNYEGYFDEDAFNIEINIKFEDIDSEINGEFISLEKEFILPKENEVIYLKRKK